MTESRDMTVRLGWGEAQVVVNVEAVSYSGEVLRDMMARALEGFAGVLDAVDRFDPDEDETEDAEAGADDA
jgi:hypothetical protein